MKEKLIEFAKVYVKLEEMSKKILSKITPSNISDGIIISRLLSQKFYFQHDYRPIVNLCKKYGINYSSLEKLKETYLAKEKETEKLKYELERIGLKNISIGPSSVYDEMGEITVLVKINEKKLNLSVFNGKENDSAKNTHEIKELRKKVRLILVK